MSFERRKQQKQLAGTSKTFVLKIIGDDICLSFYLFLFLFEYYFRLLSMNSELLCRFIVIFFYGFLTVALIGMLHVNCRKRRNIYILYLFNGRHQADLTVGITEAVHIQALQTLGFLEVHVNTYVFKYCKRFLLAKLCVQSLW